MIITVRNVDGTLTDTEVLVPVTDNITFFDSNLDQSTIDLFTGGFEGDYWAFFENTSIYKDKLGNFQAQLNEKVYLVSGLINNHVLIQPDIVRRPIFKQKYLEFQSINENYLYVEDYSSFNFLHNGSEVTILICGNTNNIPGLKQAILSTCNENTSNIGNIINYENSLFQFLTYNGSTSIVNSNSSTPVDNEDFFIQYNINSGQNLTIKINENLEVNTTPTSFNAGDASQFLRFGFNGTNFFNGNLYAILIINKTLSNEECVNWKNTVLNKVQNFGVDNFPS